jgi:hypothetical protein
MSEIASPDQKNIVHSPPPRTTQESAVQACKPPFLHPSSEIFLLGLIRELFEENVVYHLLVLLIDAIHVPADKGHTYLTLVPPPAISLHHTLAHFNVSLQLPVRDLSLILHPSQQVLFFPLIIQPTVEAIHFQRMFTFLIEKSTQFHADSVVIHRSFPYLQRA